MKRIALIGGSGASTPEFADALAVGYPHDAPRIEVVLQGRSADKLAAVEAGFRARLGGHPAVQVAVESNLDRAIDGAAIVVNQVRIGGLAARAFDERFPRALGVFGEETMGPGGFSNALRTVPALAATWRCISARAPQALVINLTNPSGVVVAAALAAYPHLDIVSVCDAPVTFLHAISDAGSAAHLPHFTTADPARYVGLNHAGVWVPPDEVGTAPFAAAHKGIDADVVAHLGAIPAPYLRFYLHPERQLEAQRATSETRAEALMRMEPTLLAEAREGRSGEQVTRRGAVWYAAVITPLIAAHLAASGGGAADASAARAAAPLILGLPNRGAAAWLPHGVVVEGVATHSKGAWEHRTLQEPPAGARAELARVAAYESALARALAPAAASGNLADAPRAALVDALAQNPAVMSTELAAKLYSAIEAAPHPSAHG